MICRSRSILNSFVPSLDNEDDPPELVMQKWQHRTRHWNDVVKQQFQLSYFGKVSYEESQEMSIHEREYMFGLLLEQKAAEKKAQEEARKAAETAHKNTPKKGKKPPRGRRRR